MRSSSFTRNAVPAATVLLALALLALAMLVAAHAAEFKQRPVLVIPDQEWTLVVREPDPLLHDPALHTFAPPERQAFAFTLANELAAHDVAIAHSAIVIGHNFGDGWNVYLGHVPSLPKGAVGPAVHGFDARYGNFAAGVEWRVQF